MYVIKLVWKQLNLKINLVVFIMNLDDMQELAQYAPSDFSNTCTVTSGALNWQANTQESQ